MALRIAISMGDYNGIGPEIILKSLQQLHRLNATPVLTGNPKVLQFYADHLALPLGEFTIIQGSDEIKDGVTNILSSAEGDAVTPSPGTFSESAGRHAMLAVEAGINLCMNGATHALVTAPISKEAVNKAGYAIPGHTEFLASKTGTDDYMMMLVHDKLRVGLVTIHIPVADIAGGITKAAVKKNMRIMHKTLQNDFNIDHPRIAVLGLNPHAGDGGIIGREEIETITPAIVDAESEAIRAAGPFPADGFFGNQKYKEFDGVLAMYHDQGLVPFKTLSFGGGVNVTSGLPMVRTSPDHGTAFDIAGKNQADPSSFQEAVKLAVRISRNRYSEPEGACNE